MAERKRYDLWLFVCLVSVALPIVRALSASNTPQQHKTHSRKTAAWRPAATATSYKKVSSTGGKSSSRLKRRAIPASVAARKQSHPTPERYAEIQAALAKAGYFQGPADGSWGASSVAALTKFQQDHALEPTGKIDSLSLIKLDLGPQYQDNAAANAGAAPPN